MDAYRFHAFATTPPPAAPELSHVPAPSLTDYQRGMITRWLNFLYLPIRETREVEEMVAKIIDRNVESPPGAKDIPIVTAPNGAGKSTTMLASLAKRYRDRFDGRLVPRDSLPTFSPRPGVHHIHCPIVWLNIPPASGVGRLDDVILDYFGASTTGTKSEKSIRALREIYNHKVEVVVVDDAHLFTTSKQRGRELLDYLKLINTNIGEAKATLVIIGADLDGTELAEDPQIRCRSVTLRIPEFDLSTTKGRAQCQAVLKDLEDTIRANVPGVEECAIWQKYAGTITDRVGGRPGDIIKLVVAACVDHIKDPTSTHLTADHIRGALISDRARDIERRTASSRRKRQAAKGTASA